MAIQDHTLPDQRMTTLTTKAYLLETRVIEKHFTHDENLEGNDHYHAMDYEDLKNFTNFIKEIKILRGQGRKIKTYKQKQYPDKNARRSYCNKN